MLPALSTGSLLASGSLFARYMGIPWQGVMSAYHPSVPSLRAGLAYSVGYAGAYALGTDSSLKQQTHAHELALGVSLAVVAHVSCRSLQIVALAGLWPPFFPTGAVGVLGLATSAHHYRCRSKRPAAS